jgi:hypothetical protein
MASLCFLENVTKNFKYSTKEAFTKQGRNEEFILDITVAEPVNFLCGSGSKL